MKKLTLQRFRALKQEVINLFKRFKDIKEARWNFSEGEEEKLIALYKELSEHDLSDIDFEEWRGMYLIADESYPRLDLSKSKANLDFSIISFYNRTYCENDNEMPIDTTPKFQNCKIKNFNFELYYHPAMFDFEFIDKNSEHFIYLDDINSDGRFAYKVDDTFYNGELCISDIRQHPKIIRKISINNLQMNLRKIFTRLGKEVFVNSLETIEYMQGDILDQLLDEMPELRSIEEIVPIFCKIARDKILKRDTVGIWVYAFPQFQEKNPDLCVREDLVENIRDAYYNGSLTLKQFVASLEYFKGKKVAHAFPVNNLEHRIIDLYGEDIYKLFSEYKPIADRLIKISVDIPEKEISKGQVSEEKRKKILSKAFLRNISTENMMLVPGFHNLLKLSMITDFVDIETLKNMGLEDVDITKEELMFFAQEYGTYLYGISSDIFSEGQSLEEKNKLVQDIIRKNVLTGKPRDDKAPNFLKREHPELFLSDEAPEELKLYFYNGYTSQSEEFFNKSSASYEMSFQVLKEHPEWLPFVEGKLLANKYKKLFEIFDNKALLKIGIRNPVMIEKMVGTNKEQTLQSWYQATGGKFVPHHVVMLNFPEAEIDSFLGNSKRWSKLMQIGYDENDEAKASILKAAYSMGVFQGSDEGFNKVMELFTGIPQEITEEQYLKVMGDIDFVWEDTVGDNDCKREILRNAYTVNETGKYVLRIDKQKDKQKAKEIRKILEEINMPRILTQAKAHQIFDSFAMEYNPDFVKFFNENVEQILTNPEYTKDIATIQRQFKDIVRTNAGRKLTLDVAQDYIRSIVYTDIEVGNEGLAEQAKIVGYSQKDFEVIQKLYNEGEIREFSSIPRIKGKTEGYTYEMLRCDDPLALTIGTLTDCCQEINGAGQTSMEHSVVSPDGRVFCVKDSEGRVVAQSWFWRNQYTGCFDNIEIPDRIFTLYEKEHPNLGKKGLTTDILEVYKKAAQDLMQEDARVYQELLENGTITKEQFDSLLLGKVTIGLGYNDIADAIKADKTIHQDTDKVAVIGTERLPHPYTDASTQYTIAEREGVVKSQQENLYVHEDEVPVFDGTNMSSSTLLTMKRMEEAAGRDNLAYLSERKDEEKLPKSQRIINSIAREYGLDPNSTKVMATARIALIYSKDKEKITIGDLLSSPLKLGLTEFQKQRATAHIMYQVKKALRQIGIKDSEVDLSSLTEEQKQILQTVMQEIEKEDSERGER